jgi:hypothetical protein
MTNTKTSIIDKDPKNGAIHEYKGLPIIFVR